MSKLIITEEEKKEILKKYNLLFEAAAPTTTFEVDKKVDFPGGRYYLKHVQKNLDEELNKVKSYLSSGTGKKFLVSVIISSGESKIPNTDNEIGGNLEPMDLANFRMKTIEDHVKKELTNYKKSGSLVSIPAVKANPPIISGPDWIGTVFCPKNLLKPEDKQGYACTKDNFNPGKDKDGKQILNWQQGKETVYAKFFENYKKAQFVKVKMKLQEYTEIAKCLNNMEINVDYVDTSELHVCNNATYRIYVTGGKQSKSEGILLLRTDGAQYASLDNDNSKYDNNPGTCTKQNATAEGCKRYNKFIVTPEIASKILEQTASTDPTSQQPYFKIWAQCIGTDVAHPKWGTGCHRSSKDPNFGVGRVTIVSGQKEKTTFEVKTPVTKGDIKFLQMVTACGEQTTTTT